jgi:hypothetical protein
MKRLFVILSLAFGLLLVAPAPEAAAWGGWNSSDSGGQRASGRRGNRGRGAHHRSHGHSRQGRSAGSVGSRTSSHGVPELDPGAAGSALVLLFGGIAYLASRRREDEFA